MEVSEQRRQCMRKYRRLRRQEHKALGLCRDCIRPLSIGGSRCLTCLTNHNNRERRRYCGHQLIIEKRIDYCRQWRQNMVKENKCPGCGAPLLEDETKCCFACLATEHKRQIKGVLHEITN